MTGTFSQHLAVIRNVLKRMFAARLGGLLNILVIGIALSLPTGLYVLLKNAEGAIAQFSGAPQISIFLDMSAGHDATDKLKLLLEENKAIAEIEFVAREQALESLQQNSGLSDLVAGLKQNPLPDAFVIQPKNSDGQSLQTLRDQLVQLPSVERVQLDSDWAYKLAAILKFGRTGVLILAMLLSLALIAITFNTIRLQILTQREEIIVAKLIGATNGFIRRPFLYFGILQGLLGGMMAWLITSASVFFFNTRLSELAQLYGSDFALAPLDNLDGLSLLVFSLYLGGLGAWLSVSRHLSEVEPH
jgi:cell division transport system permease protein